MPPKSIAILSLSCGAVFAAYLALIVATVFFATWQSGLSAAARDSEARIAALETEYFAAIDALQATDLSHVGLHEPTKVEYVAANGTPAVTRANVANP